MTRRNEDIEDFLDQFRKLQTKYGLFSVTASILGDGQAYVHGYDGKEMVEVYKKYETPAAGTAGESK